MSGLAHNFDPFTNMKTPQLPQVGKNPRRSGSLVQLLSSCKWPVIVKRESKFCYNNIFLSLLKISRALARSSARREGHDCCSTDSLGSHFL